MLQSFADAIVAFVREHEAWTYPVIFLVAFGESFCFFSLFWPGTFILAGVVGLLAAAGTGFDVVWAAMLAAAAGGSLGYALSYWIGLYFKDRVHKIWPFTRHPELIARSKEFFDKYGVFGVFLGHFFGPVRAVIPVVAGMFSMPQIPFQIANVASALLWSAGVILPIFGLVTYKGEIMEFMRDYEPAVALLMLLLALGASIPNAFLFFPPAILFVILGAFHVYAGGDFFLLWLFATAGAFIGDMVAYRFGQLNGVESFGFRLLRSGSEMAAPIRLYLKKWGALGVAASKFMWIWRAWVPVVAGAKEMPFEEFTLASAASAALWAAVFLLPGYALLALGF